MTDSSRGQFTTAHVANENVRPVINSIFDFSAESLGELKTWLEGAGLAIPITQILGFSQFTVSAADPILTGAAGASTTSTSYTDLSTAGPSLTGLPDGKYAIFFGMNASAGTAGQAAYMSVQINATTALDADSCQGGVTSPAASAGARVVVKQLAGGGNNTVAAKYRSTIGTSTATFNTCWLVALRISN